MPLFSLVSPDSSGVIFSNNLEEGLNTNVLMYEYFYNGGGVAAGDLNNDGFDDLFFSSNMGEPKLYLNRGKMKFTDITNASGLETRPGPWKTGTCIVDVNGDGLLDIFLCYSGNDAGASRQKQLFINKGIDKDGMPHFSDEAIQFGLNDTSYTTQAYFFDFDKDDDLDLLLVNHNIKRISNLDESKIRNLLTISDLNTGVELYRNEQNHFVNYTKNSGLKSTVLSHGLSASISDVNGDDWPDIYLANDYLEPDYLYINKRNGNFQDSLEQKIGHTSYYSMGSDIADINNDCLTDIYTVDMLPADNYRQKILFSPDNYEAFNINLKVGYHHQYMRNMLQLNNGNGTFSEIGQLAGISNTDWSWAPLFADFDNDGWKDLFVTNGYVRDYTNLDFLKYMGDFLSDRKVYRTDLLSLVNKMPSSNLTNYFFKNNDGIRFSDKTVSWGSVESSNSNGACYTDLDNDGDLDLVVNNINKEAFIYRNNQEKIKNSNFLELRLKGNGNNKFGIGAKVYLYSGVKVQYLEQMPTRGFQSSVSNVLHFGLGPAASIDSIRIKWPSGNEQVLAQINTNQLLSIFESDATLYKNDPPVAKALFTAIKSPFDIVTSDLEVNDFKRQPLLINPISSAAPLLVCGDVDADGLDDVYVGAGNGRTASIYIQKSQGRFSKSVQPAFDLDKGCEDADAVFVDVNNDGFKDLYVASGGYNEFGQNDPALQDRLYINNGKGRFVKQEKALPDLLVSKSCVRVCDFNKDGFADVFVGGRVQPGNFPQPVSSYLLMNDGTGNFKDVTKYIVPGMNNIGMVTDALWYDFNNDQNKDLLLVGDWMPITVLENVDGKFVDNTSKYFENNLAGWWQTITSGDYNGDGKEDFIFGNLGLNSQVHASKNEPAFLHFKDFDNNGSIDPIFSCYVKDTLYPYATRDELNEQLPMLRSRFPDYRSYASAQLDDIFSSQELADAKVLTTNLLETSCFLSSANGRYMNEKLPVQCQFAPIFRMVSLDFDLDGKLDVLMCGNMNKARLKFGNYDANYGCLLHNEGKGNFRYVDQRKSGFNIGGDVRSILQMNSTLFFGIANKGIVSFRRNNK